MYKNSTKEEWSRGKNRQEQHFFEREDINLSNLSNSFLVSILNQNNVLSNHSNLRNVQNLLAEEEADRLSASISSGTPEMVKSAMGKKLNTDFSKVRFHTDNNSIQRAEEMGAAAFASGSDIYFGRGGFVPSIAAHELVHTAQQGAVSSDIVSSMTPAGTVQMKPLPRKLTLFSSSANEYNKIAELSQEYEAATEEDKPQKHSEILTAGNAYLKSKHNNQMPETQKEKLFSKKSHLVKKYLTRLGVDAQKPETDGFQFGDDVVYGLDRPRKELKNRLVGENLEEFQLGMYQNDLTNAVWDVSNPTKRFLVKEIRENALKKFPYLRYNSEFLKHFVERTNRFNQFLEEKARQNERYNVWREFSQEEKSNLNNAFIERWKRTSKAGLDYQFHRDGEHSVYFSLGNLTPQSVIKGNGENTETNKSITSAEVRWLYRHRDQPKVRNQLKLRNPDGTPISLEDFFGESENEVGMENRKAWEKYDQYREYRRRQREGQNE